MGISFLFKKPTITEGGYQEPAEFMTVVTMIFLFIISSIVFWLIHWVISSVLLFFIFLFLKNVGILAMICIAPRHLINEINKYDFIRCEVLNNALKFEEYLKKYLEANDLRTKKYVKKILYIMR